jgi:hypothetical protein
LKIENKKTFLCGVGLTLLAALIILVPSDGTHAAGSGNMLHNLTSFESILVFIPGVLIVSHGINPESKIGVLGGVIIKLYQWIHKKR